MKCDLCGCKKATVHLTEIIDDQMTEMHLCEECAQQKSAHMEQQFGLAGLMAGLADFNKPVKDVKEEKIVCSQCGISYDDFREFGRLGCGQCYDAFKDNLSGLLKKIHGSNQHEGKTPIRIPQTKKKELESLQGLKDLLAQAIEREDFEKAVELRDKIRNLENKKKA